MIKVTLGEQPKKEKPFPKLMTSEVGQIIYAVEINNDDDGLIIGFLIHSNGYSAGKHGFSKNWSRSSFTDYNEPIILQNA